MRGTAKTGRSSRRHTVTISEPFSVYYKSSSTGDETIRKSVNDVTYKGNALDVIHLIKHRLGPTPHMSQVSFEAGLRTYKTSRDSAKHERPFNLLAAKPSGKEEIPEFLPPMNDLAKKTFRKVPYIRSAQLSARKRNEESK